MIPAEFNPADHVGPEVILNRGGEFFTFAVAAASFEEGVIRRINVFTTQIERQLIRGLIGGINTIDVAINRKILASIRETDGVRSQSLNSIPSHTKLQAGHGGLRAWH